MQLCSSSVAQNVISPKIELTVLSQGNNADINLKLSEREIFALEFPPHRRVATVTSRQTNEDQHDSVQKVKVHKTLSERVNTYLHR